MKPLFNCLILLIKILVLLVLNSKIVYSNEDIVSNTIYEPNQENKPFIQADQLTEATRGKYVSLKCNVYNIKNYRIAWLFKGLLLTLDNNKVRDDPRISINNPQPNEWVLTIDPIESNDEGYYTCVLTNGLRKMIFLRVGVSPRFTGTDASHQVLINTAEKNNVTLSCEADGNPAPTIYWYKNRIQFETGPHLFLHNISRNSDLEYECVARNKIEPDPSRHFKINVNFKPSINLMFHLKEHKKKMQFSAVQISEFGKPIDSNVNDGELQLICHIVGNPINSISWFKDGYKLKEDNKNAISLNSRNQISKKKIVSIHTVHKHSYEFESKLKIKNIDFMDNGVYECLVNGFEGNFSKSVIITNINSKPFNENELEYSIRATERNLLNLNTNSHFNLKAANKLTNKQEILNLNHVTLQNEPQFSNFPETYNLMFGRPARSNVTKSKENNFNFNECKI